MQNNIDLIVPVERIVLWTRGFLLFPVYMIDKKYKSLWKIKNIMNEIVMFKRARSWTPAPQ